MAPNPLRALLQLHEVTRAYGTGSSTTFALASVSLTVMPGEFVAIIGPSGSGKSTLLNIIGLLDSATDGVHRLSDVDVHGLRETDRNRVRSNQIGFVFQDSHVLLDDSAAVNASLGLKIQGVARRERRVRVGAALTSLGMSHRAQEKAGNLSGGERQRVAIARAMATRPALLLADEPTGALDSENTRRIIDHLRRLHRAGVTVLVITHDEVVADAATRIVRLVDGVLDDGIRPRDFADDEIESRSLSGSRWRSRWPWPSPLRRMSRRRRRPRLPAGSSDRGSTPDAPREEVDWRSLVRKLSDELLDAVSSHSGRPGRTALLLAAFLLGTGGLVCSLGISQSAATQVADRLTAASLDEVIVRAADPQNALDVGFYDRRDPRSPIRAIRTLDGVKEVGFVASVPSGNASVTLLPPRRVASQSTFRGPVRVADTEFLSAQRAVAFPTGSASLLDNSWGGEVALVGEIAAEELGVGRAGPGVVLWIDGDPVDVVGTIEDGGRDPLLTRSVLLSPSVGTRLAIEDPVLVVRTDPGFPAPLATAIPIAASNDDPESVKVETVADLRSLRTGVATDLGSLVAVSSWILLALASLSAATAMYLSVQSRAPEIALRRAIGASRLSIWRMFTLEGLVIGAAGGISGASIGLCGVLAVCAVQGWAPALDLGIVATGVAAGCVTGILSAAYPALVAARADPASAIRR